MDLILCHITADFDTLGAAIGLSRLLPGARIVLAGGAHPTVRDFLALHRDEYALIERRSVNPQTIRSLSVVDSQRRDRLGKVAEWLDLPDIPITLYDHHIDAESDISAQDRHVEAVGATTTLIVERLQVSQISLTAIEATAMALGIHVDTGSLTFDQATSRDALALAWLMGQGANLKAIAEYVDPGLSPMLQDLLGVALENLQSKTIQGYTFSWVTLETNDYVPGLSSLASRLMELTESDALLLLHRYRRGVDRPVNEANVLSVIGRSRIEGTNLNELLKPLGGGGHPKAAAVTLRDGDFQEILTQLLTQFEAQIPPSLTARELMSSPVRTIRPDTTIDEAQRILLRYGHSGLSVVDADDQIVGIISRRDLDIAFYHGFGHAPVKGYMTTNLKTIAPDARLSEIESLMVTYDIGRLPVLDQGQLVGIVTRTDVLRQLHQADTKRTDDYSTSKTQSPRSKVSLDRLSAHLQEFLAIAAAQAEQHGWHLYLVGGAVRDLLLTDSDQPVTLTDIDLVVDGFHRSADVGAGVELARSLQRLYPNVRLDVHGRFQTAALLWHKDPTFDSLWVDIATARTEFYPYPAANPEVEASSIRQDLYRRDFTVNAMALRLTNPRTGELLDFFGGSLDLQAKQIRVLHPNSFIEDPTRIYRAVRFATRLGFEIEPQTDRYIRYAIASGVYEQVQARQVAGRVIAPALQTRLKSELKYILQSSYWKAALNQLAHLDALRCVHPKLELDDELRWQLRAADRWLHRLDRSQLIPSWQLLLEVLIAHLAPSDRAPVAQNLQLSADGIDRLTQLEPVRSKLSESLLTSRPPSQIVQYLSPYELPLLILVAVKSPHAIRKQIWRYLTLWATVKSPLDGNDLKALGYKPGRQFKQILDDLLAVTLDGKVHDRAEAEEYLAEHYALDL